MTSEADTLAKLRARMAQSPKSWVDVVMVAVLKDPVFFVLLLVGVFGALAIMALLATKTLLDQITAEEKLKTRRLTKKQY